jgi:hypothetical protein
MHRRSKTSHRKRPGSKRQNQKNDQNNNQNQNNNQTGGAGEQVPQISQATLEQAGMIAQKMLNNAMSQGNNGASPTGQVGGSSGASSGVADLLKMSQTGGSAGSGVADLLKMSQTGGSAGGAGAPTAGLPSHMPQTGGSAGGEMTAPAVAQAAITGGAIAGANAGAVAASNTLSSLGGSPIMDGGRRRRKGKGKGKRGGSSSSFSSSQNDPQSQKGGMVPGLMTAVETALVPLGLYLGQKALQSRRSGNRSLGRFVDFGRRGRSSSRRTRRRGRR